MAASQTFRVTPHCLSIAVTRPAPPQDLPLSPEENNSIVGLAGIWVVFTVASIVEPLGPTASVLISDPIRMAFLRGYEPGVSTVLHLQMSQSAAVGDGMGRLANTAKLATRMKIARYLNMPVYLVFIVLSSNLVMTSASVTVY
jgi:hypothetical protein